MRTHAEIVRDYGAAAIARELAARSVGVHQSTPQRWAERDSIPGEYWRLLTEIGVAKLDELADAAAGRAARKVGESQ